MKCTLVVCLLVLLALASSVDAINSRARLTRRVNVERSGAEEKLDSGEDSSSSRSAQATINRKLGFAFVLDNGNDIETVEENASAHKIISDNKKHGGREATHKQKARDSDYAAVLARIAKENQEFSSKVASEEEGNKKKSEQRTKQDEESGAEEKSKRNAEDAAWQKAQSEESAAAEQQKKAEEQKAEEAAAAEASAQESAQKGILREKAFKPQQGSVLKQASEITFTGAYTYMFWIRPTETVGPWANIFHKGQENGNRNPAMWFYPGAARLHVRSGTEGNTNNGCDPEEQMAMNTWTHVAVVHNSWGLRVYLNGNVRCESAIGAPLSNTGPLYVSDPWHEPVRASLADFRYVARAVDSDVINAAVKAKRGTS